MVPEDSERTIIYSPIVNKRIRVNKCMAFLFSMIVECDGIISIKDFQVEFFNKLKIHLKDGELKEQLKQLKNLKFIFDSKSALAECSRATREKMKNLKMPPLSMAYLHLTMKCNFSCVYCYNRDVEKEHLKELSTEEWFNALEYMRSENIKKLVITGGEPLLREDIGEILGKAKKLGFKVSLLTNGSLLENKFAEVVPNVDDIVLSLDSHDLKQNSFNRSHLGFDGILRGH